MDFAVARHEVPQTGAGGAENDRARDCVKHDKALAPHFAASCVMRTFIGDRPRRARKAWSRSRKKRVKHRPLTITLDRYLAANFGPLRKSRRYLLSPPPNRKRCGFFARSVTALSMRTTARCKSPPTM